LKTYQDFRFKFVLKPIDLLVRWEAENRDADDKDF